ncbi:MAG: exodeoxyribonuclease V subunit beta [Methylococcales bacterium]|nr:exodeoxyribonuclease V subunit beta [Methylococcales bacterium]
MHINYFDAAHTELLQGINLIEASAGTGKTFAIAMLVLRFVVEQDIAIEKILVVTFTKAATEELRDRVRSRLAMAKRILESLEAANEDEETVLVWLEQLELEPEVIKQRLELALLNIDQASIFTIHSFCQRVLREHALESGQLFDAELTDDLASITQACVDDFWREQIYSRTQWQVAVLTAHYNTPDALLASIQVVADHVTVYPSYENLDDALHTLESAVNQANTELDNYAVAIRASFADDKFNASYRSAFEEGYPLLAAWLQGGSTQIPTADSLALLTGDGLLAGLNGNQFRANKSETAADRKANYVASLDINPTPFEQLADAVQHVTLILRRTLLETLRTQLDKRLQQLNLLSLDNLITRLADALTGDKAELLTMELRVRFTAALIDEFQDTDDSQWGIFSTVFASDSHFLYLIGDPKQAIYKFRGADIYSYLAARKQADYEFSLGKNWRSHPQLVNAVNALFQRQDPFLLPELTFHPVAPAKSAADGELWSSNLGVNSEAVTPMVLWQLPASNENTGYWGKKDAEQEICIAVCNEIVTLLNQPYQLRSNKSENTPVQPKDIAILVKTNQQAQDYQAALREVGVPAVLNSVESIFSSPEAVELHTLLNAVANPSDSGLLKHALTLSWFALDGQALYALFNDETALDAWMARFSTYYQAWQKVGLMAMMQQLLTQEAVCLHLAKTNRVERQLTNIYYVIELTHQAAVNDHLGINKTLDWLHAAQHKNSSSEAQKLRLESDEDAVKIVTMHSSKGLEYPIVFCPFLWQRSGRLHREKQSITCHDDDKMIVDLGSEHFEKHREQAIMEELAEDLRVVYVAVTRAKYRCYLAWANVRTKDKPNDSALAWLLGFADCDFSQQQTALENLAQQHPNSFTYQLLNISNSTHGSYQKQQKTQPLHAKQRLRRLYTHWQMSSYTALSALSQHDAPELPEDKAREQGELLIPRATLDELPKGAHTGNVVHDLLENHTFSDLAQRKDISGARDKACQRYSLKLDKPELLEELLENVVKTPLFTTDTDACLMNVAEAQCLKEMPFYLAVQDMDAQQINKILQDTPAYQALSSKALCGYLTGFIDLICEYDGRYYVIDYKTNYLTDYNEANLTVAMREHNYGLQYWIYTVVLHRYLQNRLPNYNYEYHFGGVRYLFVRGMQPDVAMSGVYQDKPDYQRINQLVALFGV